MLRKLMFGGVLLVILAAGWGPISGLADMPSPNIPAPPSPPLPSPSPSPTPTPTPSNPQLDVSPVHAPPQSQVQVSGARFLPNQSLTLLWDNQPSKVLGSPTTDSSGTFTISVSLPDDTAGVHQIYVQQPPNPFVHFTLDPPLASPSPTPSPSPSASDTPSIAPRIIEPGGGGGGSGLGFLLRPPFVFFPILFLLGVGGAVAYVVYRRRRPAIHPPPGAARITHHAARPLGAEPWTPPRPPGLPTTPPGAAPPPQVPQPPPPQIPAPGDAWPAGPTGPPKPPAPPADEG